MLTLGETPQVATIQDLDLEEYSSTMKYKISDAGYVGRALLVCFVEYTNGWSWLESMRNVWTNASSHGNFEILAVIFRYNGTPSKTAIITKIGSETYPFKVLVDNTWGTSSAAYKYMTGFKTLNDPEYDGTNDACAGDSFWAYLLQHDHKIVDKWRYDSMSTTVPSKDDPISFKNLSRRVSFLSLSGVPGSGEINIDLINAVAGTTPLAGDARITYHAASSSYIPDFSNPRIIYAIPADGSSPLKISPVIIGFSDNVIGYGDLANFEVGGVGIGTLAATTVEYGEKLVFDSKDSANLEFYLRQRLIHIANMAAVLYTEPERLSLHRSIMQIKIYFSRAMDKNTIHGHPENFLPNQSGVSIDSVAYEGRDMIENIATLNLSGTFSTGDLTISIVNVLDLSGNLLADAVAVAYRIDTTPPAIAPLLSSIDFDARTITVKFTEGVYANADGTGALQNADFSPTIHNSSATISNVQLPNPIAAGSDTAVFVFSASGTPDGSEYVSIAPVNAFSIYDVAGNPMAAAETTGNLYLPDRKAPAVPAPAWDTPDDDNTPTISWADDPDAAEFELTIRDTADTLMLIETLAAGTTSYTVPSAQALADGSYTVFLRARDAGLNWSASGSVDLAIAIPPPALPRDIVLALDYSGSMNSPVSFDGTTKSKKAWIQDAANDFFNHVLSHVSDDYKLGVVSYATKAVQALGLTDKAALEANHALFGQALASVPQGSTTAMGKAMAHSLSMLGYLADDATFGASRAIVLMADGQQNVNPRVVFSGGTPPTSLAIDTNQAPADCPAGMGIVTVADGRIPVHTFGIGGNDPWLDDLADLSQLTSGTVGADGAIWPEAFNYLVGICPQLFPHSSPQIVRNEVASFRKGERREFPINAGIAKLTVCLNWAGGAPLRCGLYQGRMRVRFDSITEKEGLYIGTVKFPHSQLVGRAGGEPRYAFTRQARSRLGLACATKFDSPVYEVKGQKPRPGIDLPQALRQIVQPRGTWTLVVEGAPSHAQPPDGYTFNMSVIVDEKRIKYSLRPFKRVVQPRESLELGIGFFRGGVPLAAAATAKTTITRPLLDFDAALALDPAAVKKALSVAAAAGIDIKDDAMRTQVLARDPAIAKLLARRVDSRLTLGSPLFAMLGARSARGEGISKRFADTPTQGPYRIEHLVRIDLGKEGVYERIVRDWAQVRT